MFKQFFVLVLVVIVGIAAVYFFGVAGYDPEQEGIDNRAKIQAGMSWEEVVAATKPPRKFQSIATRPGEGGIDEEYVTGENEFHLETFRAKRGSGRYDKGFYFLYRYTNKVAYSVNFNGEGKVEGVSDLPTMADLLQQR